MDQYEIYRDAYPEQRIAAMRDEIRRAERVLRAREGTELRRLERRAALRARLTRWFPRWFRR